VKLEAIAKFAKVILHERDRTPLDSLSNMTKLGLL